MITANLYSSHIDPNDFPEPEKYKPSRFIDEDGKMINSDRVIPFGMGNLIFYN